MGQEGCVVLADDDHKGAAAVAAVFARHGWRHVHHVGTFDELRGAVETVQPSALVLEPQLAGSLWPRTLDYVQSSVRGGGTFRSRAGEATVGATVGVVLLTSYPSRAMLARAHNIGALIFAKPADPESIVVVVESLCDELRGARAASSCAGNSPSETTPETAASSQVVPNAPPARDSGRGCACLACHEWEHINDVLVDAKGNASEAARRLGISRSTLHERLRKHPPRHFGQAR